MQYMTQEPFALGCRCLGEIKRAEALFIKEVRRQANWPKLDGPRMGGEDGNCKAIRKIVLEGPARPLLISINDAVLSQVILTP